MIARVTRLGMIGVLLAGAVTTTGALAAPRHGGRHGQRRARERTRRVFVGAPTVSIASPLNGADYTVGETVSAAYTCAASAPAVLSSCAGPVPSGSPLPSSSPGVHSFTVKARDSYGGSATQTVVYIVSAGQTPAAQPAGQPPVLSALRESAASWREGADPVRISTASVPTGTAFSFSLNEPAAVTFSFLASGGAHASAALRERRAAVDGGSFSFPARSGTNRVLFDGRLGAGQWLASGRYTLVVTATDTAGQSSSAPRLQFSVVG